MSANSDPGADGVAPEFFRVVRLVDAFEAGRKRRSIDDAAEIRVLADAAAAVARPADATPDRARRAELDRRALVADLATSARVSEWTVTSPPGTSTADSPAAAARYGGATSTTRVPPPKADPRTTRTSRTCADAITP
ncbi:hypothetical protein [Microbacterium trichothecenolyticum]|uniref:hypothetical protein n=1 Tax=Microbacterium trichothecenolyticum TaxID=69370 RepID=UPI0005ED094A